MLSLDQDTVNLITIIAVINMIPILGFMIVSLLMRQLSRFGFTHSWGDNARDININEF